MARPLKPLVHSGGWYPSKKWIPLVRNGGYTTQNGGEQPEPEAVLKTVTGSLIHITDALALPAEALSVNVEPIQAGSGDPSPDNVRPISGRTSATVTRTGRNLLNSSIVHGIWTLAGWYDHENYNTKYLSTRYAVPVVGGKTYCFSLKNDSSNPAASGSFIAFANGNAIGETAAWFSVENGIINVPSGADSIVINILLTNNFASISDVSATDFQLELGSTASAYEPYQGNTYTITLGDTVYGGTLDVTGGKMMVDRVIWTKNTATMNNLESYPGWKNSGVKALIGDELAGTITAILNIGSQFSANTRGNNDVVFLATGTYGKTQTEWQALAIDVQIVVPLATPIEITLTPTQIDMLLGENNLWADAGDLTLTYYADGNASTSEALGILLGGTYNNPGGADDVSDDEALGILLGGS